MKTLRTLILGIAVMGLGLLVWGCQSQPKTPAPTPTEEVIVVVVTATTQPTIEATQPSEPTITPLATFTPIGSPVATATTAATATATRKVVIAVPSTPKPARTNTPAPTAAPAKSKYAAPQAISPGPDNPSKDGNDISFKFSSVGPLGTNECYQMHVQMVNPNATGPSGVAGDFFMDPGQCGDQSPVGKIVTFTLFRGKYMNKPNYGTIEAIAQNAAPADLLKTQWFVTVVQNNGMKPDGVHFNTVPLSPNSATLEFPFYP